MLALLSMDNLLMVYVYQPLDQMINVVLYLYLGYTLPTLHHLI